MTQNERLLMHLKQHGTIQPMEAWNDLGIYRLGARIYDLRDNGYAITKQTVSVINRHGKECRVAEYKLEKP